MAADTDHGPFLANVTVLLGFVVLFSVFAVDSPMAVVVGVVMIAAGALWSGLAGGGMTDGRADG